MRTLILICLLLLISVVLSACGDSTGNSGDLVTNVTTHNLKGQKVKCLEMGYAGSCDWDHPEGN